MKRYNTYILMPVKVEVIEDKEGKRIGSVTCPHCDEATNVLVDVGTIESDSWLTILGKLRKYIMG